MYPNYVIMVESTITQGADAASFCDVTYTSRAQEFKDFEKNGLRKCELGVGWPNEAELVLEVNCLKANKRDGI